MPVRESRHTFGLQEKRLQLRGDRVTVITYVYFRAVSSRVTPLSDRECIYIYIWELALSVCARGKIPHTEGGKSETQRTDALQTQKARQTTAAVIRVRDAARRSPAGAWCVLEGKFIDVLVDITSGALEPPAPVQEAAMCEGSDWFKVRVEE